MIESGKEDSGLTHKVKMVAELLPTSNREVRATSIEDEPEKEHEVQHKPVTNKRRKEMNAMMKI